jgi:hypothetical protein
MNRALQRKTITIVIALVAGLPLSSLAISDETPSRFAQMSCRALQCRPLCNKTLTQDSSRCQEDYVRSVGAAFRNETFQRCLRSARSIYELCIAQCNNMGC